MAERHGAAIDVHLVAVELQIADELFGHHGEGLVDLEEVDVVRRKAGAGEHAARRRHRRVQHQGRAIALVGPGHHARPRFEAMAFRIVRRCQQERRRAVHDAGRIAGMMDVPDLEVGIFLQDQFAEGQSVRVERHVGKLFEGRLQRGQAFGRRAGARKLLPIERNRAVVVVDGHEALREMPALDRGVGPLLAFQCQRVDIGARNALHGRDGIGADALIGLRMQGAQMHIAGVEQRRPVLGTAAVRHGHHFGAAGHHEIGHAREDGRSGEIDRGDPRSAEAVQRDAAAAHVIAGIERRHPAEIAALRPALRAGAPDHVVDLGGVDVVARRQRLQHGRAQALRMDLRQRALGIFADAARRADGIDDPGFGHGRCP